MYKGRTFKGGKLLQTAMPMGGIGAGCVCLNGHGGLQDWSLRHRPALDAEADGHATRPGAFGLLHIKGERPVTKLLEGPLPVEKIYDQGLQAQGYRHGGYDGLPRFAECSFTGSYPFGRLDLSHPQVPLKVAVTGWSPFIPLDDKDSSLPCAILEYRFENTSAEPVEFEFSYHLSHLAVGAGGNKGTRSTVLPGAGIHFTNSDDAKAVTFGGTALEVVGGSPRIKGQWLRSGWFDWVGALWREVSEGRFTENQGNPDREIDGINGGSVQVAGRLEPGESMTCPIIIAWYFPNSDVHAGDIAPTCECGSGCGCASTQGPRWRPYYVSQWKDAADVAAYVRKNYEQLKTRTTAFRDALASSTLPAEVLDAVMSNLAILKSPTVLRQENGNVWAWEGCFANNGCCHGSCTHVWNYAQAMPHLFPKLERTMREQELERSMDDRGHVNFRAALPDGPTAHDFHPAADGQLGGIMKLFRDWQISGDRSWLARLYPLAKRSLDFCIERWDPEHRGALFEPHHNTYDIEFWGPDGMCTSVYVGALAAMSRMAKEMGQADDAAAYRGLAEKGARFLDEQLFNGEYFFQKVMWKELRDQSFAKSMDLVNDSSDELQHILKAEGPRYQYGAGCLSDGVIGDWMARLYGIDTPQNRENVRKTLASIFKYNFKRDLGDHACTQRPGYAIGHESALLVCSWPHGDKPTLPFVYSDEVFTGIEYQVAAHMLGEGMVEEGLAIVRGVRARYEGHVRNPFNEYECGSYYARALASYALLAGAAGFRYSAATRELWLAPHMAVRPFRIFFSAATGFGTLTLGESSLTISMVEGELAVDTIHLGEGAKAMDVAWGKVAKGRRNTIKLARPE